MTVVDCGFPAYYEQLLPPFNEDARQARQSLSRLEHLAARVIVVGHGSPFEGTPAEAVEAARARSV